MRHLVSDCRKAGLADGLCLVGLRAGPVAAGGGAGDRQRADRRSADDDTTGGAVGRSLLEAVLLHTNDVQSLALLSCVVGSQGDAALAGYVEGYRELLEHWGLTDRWTALVRLKNEAERAKGEAGASQAATQVPRGAVLYCYYCQGPLMGPLPRSITVDINIEATVTCCPNERCKKAVPYCSVCLVPVTLLNMRHFERTGGADQFSRALPFKDWLVWCESCHHGGHMEHLQDWFARFKTCPVADCACNCGELF